MLCYVARRLLLQDYRLSRTFRPLQNNTFGSQSQDRRSLAFEGIVACIKVFHTIPQPQQTRSKEARRRAAKLGCFFESLRHPQLRTTDDLPTTLFYEIGRRIRKVLRGLKGVLGD